MIENLPEELDPVLDPLLGRWKVAQKTRASSFALFGYFFFFFYFIIHFFHRMFIKRGTAIKLGDKEVARGRVTILFNHLQVEYNPNFKLFLHTKIANPHYKPELQVCS